YTAGEQPPGAYVVRSTDGGKSWSKPMLAHEGAVTSDAPVLTLAGKTLHLFWHAKMADGVRRVFTRASSDMGASFGPVSELPTPTGAPAQLPAIAGRPDGSVQVAWQQGTEVRTARWVSPQPPTLTAQTGR
ncbi:MAG: exo-alpha-sialidase, partial [Gammaproteobacteria bacterium]|nr:exo-alpha-sialidase [Gammaproteobacteria bacterium]